MLTDILEKYFLTRQTDWKHPTFSFPDFHSCLRKNERKRVFSFFPLISGVYAIWGDKELWPPPKVVTFSANKTEHNTCQPQEGSARNISASLLFADAVKQSNYDNIHEICRPGPRNFTTRRYLFNKWGAKGSDRISREKLSYILFLCDFIFLGST